MTTTYIIILTAMVAWSTFGTLASVARGDGVFALILNALFIAGLLYLGGAIG